MRWGLGAVWVSTSTMKTWVLQSLFGSGRRSSGSAQQQSVSVLGKLAHTDLLTRALPPLLRALPPMHHVLPALLRAEQPPPRASPPTSRSLVMLRQRLYSSLHFVPPLEAECSSEQALRPQIAWLHGRRPPHARLRVRSQPQTYFRFAPLPRALLLSQSPLKQSAPLARAPCSRYCVVLLPYRAALLSRLPSELHLPQCLKPSRSHRRRLP